MKVKKNFQQLKFVTTLKLPTTKGACVYFKYCETSKTCGEPRQVEKHFEASRNCTLFLRSYMSYVVRLHYTDPPTGCWKLNQSNNNECQAAT